MAADAVRPEREAGGKVSIDNDRTVVDGPREQARDDTATHLATSTGSSPGSTTIHLPVPETVLRASEIEQSRATASSGMVFSALSLAISPLMGGDVLARTVFQIAVTISIVNNLVLFLVSRNERRYQERFVIGYFVAAAFLNTALTYYVGVFSPILAMFVFNLYVACLGYNQRVAFTTLLGGTLPVVGLGGAITIGWLADRGLISVTSHVDTTGRVVIIGMFTTFMIMSYVQARKIRVKMLASLVERDAAVRQASHREALFLEARQDLERALCLGGFGRFTDQTLGSYRLGAVLGRGGMGEVYEANHVESGEPAAIKMLLPEVLMRPDYVRRFMREVRIAASLDSPHVVAVREVGDENAPLPYLAMERLEGEDLAQILRRRERLPIDEVVDLVRQTGLGIEAANAAGIVHRDLKPQNLFLTNDQTWKILDFGVSQLWDGEGTLTRGEAVGTPQYMSPEQARGQRVDIRADLYSLGAIAYRALTGHRPFTGENVGFILAAVLTAMPQRPGSLAKLPTDVDRVLAIALAKNPDDRFATAEKFAQALEAAANRELSRSLRRRGRKVLAEHPWEEVD